MMNQDMAVEAREGGAGPPAQVVLVTADDLGIQERYVFFL